MRKGKREARNVGIWITIGKLFALAGALNKSRDCPDFTQAYCAVLKTAVRIETVALKLYSTTQSNALIIILTQ